MLLGKIGSPASGSRTSRWRARKARRKGQSTGNCEWIQTTGISSETLTKYENIEGTNDSLAVVGVGHVIAQIMYDEFFLFVAQA
jgi:hypothetical protein